MNRLLLTILIISLFAFNYKSTAQVTINEVYAWSVDNELPTDSFKINDWIELYNDGSIDYDLSGHYISDDPKKVDKYQLHKGTIIKAKSYLIIWADGKDTLRHANFKLNSRGEHLILSNPDLKSLDEFKFEEAENRWVAGRQHDGKIILYSHISSPMAPNKNLGLKNKHKPTVEAVPKGRFAKIYMHCEKKSCDIIFDMWGVDPLKEEAIYEGPFLTRETVTVSARCAREKYAAGELLYKTVFANDNILARENNFLIVNINADDEELWGQVSGIHAKGVNGTSISVGNSVGNYHQKWEIPAEIQVYTPDGGLELKQKVGLQIGGFVAAAYQYKPFAIYARSRYGNETITYPFFKDKSITEFTHLLLRNSGGADGTKTLFRDAFASTLIRQNTDLMYQAYRPVIAMLNGQYWGIMNLREKINEYYISSNSGIPIDSLNMVEHFRKIEVTHGVGSDYIKLIDTLQSKMVTASEKFKMVEETIDLDDQIDYHIMQMFAANSDWPANNVGMYRHSKEGAKWKYILFDLDASWGIFKNLDRSYFFDPFKWMENHKETNMWNKPWATVVYRTSMSDQSYKEEFIQRFAAYLNTSLNPGNMLSLIDSFAENLRAEIPHHAEAWSSFKSLGNWNKEVNTLREFARNRTSVIRGMILEHFDLNGTADIKFIIEPENSGAIHVNGVYKNSQHLSGLYFKGIPIKLKAVPKDGFEFSHWESTSSESSTWQFTVREAKTIKAVFKQQ